MATLTQRECEIARHIAAGATNAEIGRDLQIAESTVRAHVRVILGKLDLRNRTQVATWYVRRSD